MTVSSTPIYSQTVGLNIFYSGIKYTEKDWVRHKVRHYALQKGKAEVQKHITQIGTTQIIQRKKKNRSQTG